MLRYGDIRKLRFHGRRSLRYYVRVCKADGRTTWRCTGFVSLELARAQVRQWQLEAIGGVGAGGTASAGDLLWRWQREQALGKSRNWERLLRGFARRVAPAVDGVTPSHVTSETVRAWIAGRLSAGRMASTVNAELALWRLWGRWLVDHGYVVRNPVPARMRLPVPWHAPRVVSPAEELRLLEAAQAQGERAYGYVLLLLSSGFRAALSERVRWEHVDIEAREWTIPAALMKSRREYRQPIMWCMALWLAAHLRAEGVIFGSDARRVWWRVRAQAGLPTLTRHDLRRSFITRCRRRGLPIEITMALADHVDLSTMLRVYRRVDADDVRGALRVTWCRREDSDDMATGRAAGSLA